LVASYDLVVMSYGSLLRAQNKEVVNKKSRPKKMEGGGRVG
jgi:hypothetical protein